MQNHHSKKKDLSKRTAKLEKELATRDHQLKIEAALEKVRSRSLTMHKSEELKEVVAVLFQQLQELEFGVDKGAAVVMTYSQASKDHTQWIADAGQAYAIPFFVAYSNHPIPADIFKARTNRSGFFSRLYKPKEKNNYFRYL